jgi:hypothetical protein
MGMRRGRTTTTTKKKKSKEQATLCWHAATADGGLHLLITQRRVAGSKQTALAGAQQRSLTVTDGLFVLRC